MSKVNIKGLVQHIKTRTNVYTPLVEAIVNSIQAITTSGREDGKITVKILRSAQTQMQLSNDAIPLVTGFEIIDNGVGFTKENRESFDTVYSNFKTDVGGKGFGRFTFLKYFENISVNSIYKEDDKLSNRKFSFGREEQIIVSETNSPCTEEDIITKVELSGLKEGVFDKKIETISRKVLEKILIYFIDDNYRCPKIVFIEENERESIVLNDYLNDERGAIKEIASRDFSLTNEDLTEKFVAKVFKIYFPDKQRSRISLTAHNREVTETPLYKYVPEFEENFYENYTNENDESSTKDYMIKTYVLGKYLDNNVSLERSSFNFPRKENGMSLFPLFSEEEIEKQAATITEESFPDEILSRKNKKKTRIDAYINDKAPWHKSYINELDLSTIPYKLEDIDIEMELQKAKFKREQTAKIKVAEALKVENGDLYNKVESLVKEITDIGKGDLAHYVALRKTVIDLFKKSLQVNSEGKYEKEDVVHNIIFPIKSDSDNLPYADHNLWLVDEKLNFTEYISSDKPLESTGKRPDLLIYNNKLAFRGDNEASNPITVFEFKRPQRDDFTNPSSEEDPIEQVVGYVNKIRRGEYTTPSGRNINVTENTPFYGFVVCDLTPKVKKWLKEDKDFKEMPDGMGWYDWRININLYIEVLSWDKILKDAELRNKIFFRKLGIE